MRVAFFVSGQGTIFESLTTRMREGVIPAVPALVISSSKTAGAIARAEKLGVPCIVVRRDEFGKDEDFASALLNRLAEYEVNFVCLAGYLKLVPKQVVERFQNRMLNIHPALLPAFGGQGMYGRKVFEAALDYGVRIHGATVHLVDDHYDHGPIVLQRAVFVASDDTPETLQARVHNIEYDLYADALRLFAENRVRVEGRHTQLLPTTTQQ